jgi:hypothetical protein
MSKHKSKTAKFSLFLGIIALVIAIGAIAITPANTRAQIISVEQLIDIRPTDYYYQALKSLTEEYGCTAGYPDGTFRPNKSLTRYETAGTLSSCIDQFLSRMGSSAHGSVTKEEVVSLKKMVDSLRQEVDLIRRSRPSDQPRIRFSRPSGQPRIRSPL